MVIPRRAQDQTDVASHYDVLDAFYRSVWGEHVHHGLWRTGRETPREATLALSRLVIAHAALGDEPVVADAGCGYGGTARLLARHHGARVTAFTLSAAQAAAAERVDGVEVRVRSWLENGLADASCDAVIAIESLSHMSPKEEVFAQAARVLRPGGRLVLVDWLAHDDHGPVETALMLEPIARTSRLPSLCTRSEYAAYAGAAGLELLAEEDLSKRVRRTWAIVARRVGRRLLTDRAARRALLGPANPDRGFVVSIALLPLGYTTGAMQLRLMAFEQSLV